jgi:hypothetical protein
MNYTGVFAPLNNDSYAPDIPKLALQQWDNYGIYSLACIDLTNRKLSKTRKYKRVGIGAEGEYGEARLIAFDPVLNQESFDLLSGAWISQDAIDGLPSIKKEQVEDLLRNLDKVVEILSLAERQLIITLKNSLNYPFSGDTLVNFWAHQRLISINPGQIDSSRTKELSKVFQKLTHLQFADNTNKSREIQIDENLSALAALAILYGIERSRIKALNNPIRLKMAKWLAWQNFAIESIPIDFRSIVETYHDVGNTVCSYDGKIGHYLFKNLEDFGGGYVIRETYNVNNIYTGRQILVDSAYLSISGGTPGFDPAYWKPYITDRDVFDFWSAPLPLYESIWDTREIIGTNVIENDGSRYFDASTPFTEENYLLKPITRIAENATRAYRFSSVIFINVPSGITGLQPGRHRLEYWVQPQAWNVYRNTLDKPCYLDLVAGYCLDPRKIARQITLKSDTKKIAKIGYYRNNPYEQISNKRNGLTSIDWFSTVIYLDKNVELKIDVSGIVLGTFYCDSELTISIAETNSNDLYPVEFLKYNQSNTATLFASWLSLYDAEVLRQSTEYPEFMPFTNSGLPEVETGNKLRLLAAHNNHWNNTEPLEDIGTEANHPLFKVDNSRTYDYHFKPQIDGSIGNLKMDSINIINIAKALEADKYSTNELDPDVPRVPTLGWHINRQSEILGIRVKADGKIDETLEKKEKLRLHVEGLEKNDPQEYGINSFGSKGILVRHLCNKFAPDGKNLKTVAGGYRKIHDLPQYLAELHEQANAAVGYQEGTAIEIQLDGETYRYPNQLALLTELFVTAKQTATYSKGAFFSSVVGEQSIKEVMAGLGLRTVDKFIEFEVAGKVAKLYYKGISASQSIRRKLSAVATNIGITIGNII